MSCSTFLVVGLGNPGEQYTTTRHNVGWLLVDELSDRWKCPLATNKWQALSGKTQLNGYSLILLKPMTFMNLSGRALVECMSFYKIPPHCVLILHDDLDVPKSQTKLVAGGGHGGHNGIRSIAQLTGETDFYRLKYGIGRPGKDGVHPDMPVEKYVLSAMNADELRDVISVVDKLEAGIHFLAKGEPPRAMNLINSKNNPLTDRLTSGKSLQ